MAGDPAVFEDVWRVVESLWDALLRYEPRSQCHQSLYDEVLARFNDFSDERTNRLSASRLKIPLALQILLRSGAALTIGSMYLFSVDSLAIHALMTAALAIAISQILYVIGDLDDCFAGDWQVPREPFRRVRRYMAAAAAAR